MVLQWWNIFLWHLILVLTRYVVSSDVMCSGRRLRSVSMIWLMMLEVLLTSRCWRSMLRQCKLVGHKFILQNTPISITLQISASAFAICHKILSEPIHYWNRILILPPNTGLTFCVYFIQSLRNEQTDRIPSVYYQKSISNTILTSFLHVFREMTPPPLLISVVGQLSRIWNKWLSNQKLSIAL